MFDERSIMKVEFLDSGKTLFVDLVKTNGDPRPWSTDPKPNTARWRWDESNAWLGPCGHSAQLQYGYWFFFKTASASGSCEGGNYENTVYASDGFKNRDGATFWPQTGWSSKIRLYVKVVRLGADNALPGDGRTQDRFSMPKEQKLWWSGWQTTYTAPDGTTVTSSKSVYTNNGYYYLANLFDGSLRLQTIVHVEGTTKLIANTCSTGDVT